MIPANVSVPTQSNALEDRHLIQALVDANVPHQGLTAPVLKSMMKLHVGAHVQIDHRDAPIIKHSITILVSVNVPPQSNVLEDRSLIPTLVDVNVLNQGLTAHLINTLTVSTAGVPAKADRKDAPIIKHSIMTPVRASARPQSNVQVDKALIQIPVDVNAPPQGLRVSTPGNMTI